MDFYFRYTKIRAFSFHSHPRRSNLKNDVIYSLPIGYLDVLARDEHAIVVCGAQVTTMINRKLILPRVTAYIALLCALHFTPAFAQKKAERFWLAGRYDGNRVVIYFDAVKFEGTASSIARSIAPPVADDFFEPMELPASYIIRFQKTPNAEHFSLGDRYDLLLGNGLVATVKLTTVVGCETDEPVGNDSYVGALATIEDKDLHGLLTKGYYAVRRHEGTQRNGVEAKPDANAGAAKYAVLLDGPVPFDVESQLAELLTSRMKAEASDAEKKAIGKVSPALKVQSFQLADGSLRYYVRAEWNTGKDPTGMSNYLLAAWVAPLPTLHSLALEKRTSPYGGINDGLPDLLNVVGLGTGKTGIILSIRGEDNSELTLREYKDGASAEKMPVAQSIGAGE
jgi:hypothetical protein